MTVTLLHGGVITTAIAPEQKAPDAVLVADGKIAWIGDSTNENDLPENAAEAERIDLAGGLVTPTFHDAKLDLCALGYHLTSVDTDSEPAAPQQISHALQTALVACARAGYGFLNHHQVAPSAAEMQTLTELAARDGGEFPRVDIYIGDRTPNAEHGHGFASLAVDGNFSSHDAALVERYSDLPPPQWSEDDPGSGETLLTVDEIAAHLVAATKLGVPATLAARGDRALDDVRAAFEAAAQQVGAEALRGAGHQVECADLIDATTLTTLVLFDVTIIAYPQVVLENYGAGGLYMQRLGPVRAQALHPWADLITTGIELRFASDAPHHALDPWGTVFAALSHPDRGQRMTMIDAFGAHTGGNIALLPGQAANFAVWAPGRTAKYPLRTRRGYGQLETVITLPALDMLGPDGLEGPLHCVQVFRQGRPLRMRHAEE